MNMIYVYKYKRTYLKIINKCIMFKLLDLCLDIYFRYKQTI